MSITHKHTLQVLPSGGTTSTGTISETGSAEVVINDIIPISSTNLLRTTSIVAANIQSIYLLSNSDLTIKTNSPTSPANTINLKANLPFVWSRSSAYFPAPITVDVTALYFTNGAAATPIMGRFLTS